MGTFSSKLSRRNIVTVKPKESDDGRANRDLTESQTRVIKTAVQEVSPEVQRASVNTEGGDSVHSMIAMQPGSRALRHRWGSVRGQSRGLAGRDVPVAKDPRIRRDGLFTGGSNIMDYGLDRKPRLKLKTS